MVIIEYMFKGKLKEQSSQMNWANNVNLEPSISNNVNHFSEKNCLVVFARNECQTRLTCSLSDLSTKLTHHYLHRRSLAYPRETVKTAILGAYWYVFFNFVY